MPAYRLYFFHPHSDEIVRLEEIEAACDEAAIEAVQTYRGSRVLEVWRANTKVHCNAATDLASRLAAVGAPTPKQGSLGRQQCHVEGD